MKKWMDLISEEIEAGFEAAGYDKKYGKVVLSNRPDLCEFQCNGAMAAAKQYKKAPLVIAQDVNGKLGQLRYIKSIEVVAPGFMNIMADEAALSAYLSDMNKDEELGIDKPEKEKMVLVDFGGPNVAKPLHVGHLRSAIIGESVKRILRKCGYKVLGDIHLGDWGYQMGLIIAELQELKPDLVYYDESFDGEYPDEAPFSIGELEEIYPRASAKAKEDEAFREKALHATYLLQNGHKGYTAIWNHIMKVSVADLKKNYSNLLVEFDLWKGESDAQPYIPAMIDRLKAEGFAKEDQGALVIDVKEESDAKEIPPCMIQKSDGASLYGTTDLATLVQRMEDYHPDEVIYIVDKRQELHFIQVFRAARKSGIVGEGTRLFFLGFGTMNGKDGKAFKTREGGVMRLENLIAEIEEEMQKKILENREIPRDEAMQTAKMISIAAIKYGDLSNQASKDYIFDIQRFTSFEGNTGPYILYTLVRIKSILSKYRAEGKNPDAAAMDSASGESEKVLMLKLAQYNEMMENAARELAPHKVCAYVYEVADTFSQFYHKTKILTEPDERKREGYIALLTLTKKTMEACISVLGFEAPDRM